jgi:hypothetical protein
LELPACGFADGGSVVCPKCGPFSLVRYCGKDHLWEDAKMATWQSAFWQRMPIMLKSHCGSGGGGPMLPNCLAVGALSADRFPWSATAARTTCGRMPRCTGEFAGSSKQRSALRANNGAPIRETTGDLAVCLLAKNANYAQVPPPPPEPQWDLSIIGILCQKADCQVACGFADGGSVELLGCGSRFIILRRLGWRRRTTFHSIFLGRSVSIQKEEASETEV